METKIVNIFFANFHICSYPTYEEWKHTYGVLSKAHNPTGSYPTYEEWKQLLIYLSCECLVSSYPTYEEWKHILPICFLPPNSVLILPMRNGNKMSQ